MNPFMLILMVFEALIALGGLAFTVYCISGGLHVVGVIIGLTTALVFGLMTAGMWIQHAKKH